MKKSLCMLISVSVLLTMITFNGAKANTVDESPWVNVAALAYGRSPDYTHEEAVDMAKKFDLFITGQQGICAMIKEVAPTDIILGYANSTNTSQGDSLSKFLEGQPNPEDYYLNSTSPDTVQNINNKNYKRNINERVSSFGWGLVENTYGTGTRWTTDYISPTSRAKLVEYFSNRSNLLPNTDGWFFDNMDRGGSYSGTLTAGSVDHINTVPFTLSAGVDMETALNDLRADMNTGIPSDIYFIDNIANYGISSFGPYGWKVYSNQLNGQTLSRSYCDAVKKTRGTLQEFEYRITTCLPEFEQNYGGLKEIWNALGSPSHNLYVMWWLSSGYGVVPNNSDRVKLFALSTHLLYQFPVSYIRYDGMNKNNTPLTGDWFGAMGAPLGTAQGEKTALDSSTYRRTYSNGVVLTRFRLLSTDDYTSSGTYSLGETYYPVNADGTYGSPVTEVTLQNSEGFVGVLDPGAIPIPTPTPSILPPLDMSFSKDTLQMTGSSKIVGNFGTNSINSDSISFTGTTGIEGNLSIGSGADWTEVINSTDGLTLEERVTGEISNLISAREYPMPEFPEIPDLPDKGSFTAGWWPAGPHIIDQSGSYQSIDVTNLLTVNVGNEDIKIVTDQLNVTGSGSIIVNRTGKGKLILYVTDQINITGSGKVNDNGSNNDIVLYYSGNSDINLGGDTKFIGSVFAQNANVTIEGSGCISGHVITGGSTINITGNSEAEAGVVYAPNAVLNLTESAKIEGIAIAQSIQLSGDSRITYDNSINLDFLEQLDWGLQPTPTPTLPPTPPPPPTPTDVSQANMRVISSSGDMTGSTKVFDHNNGTRWYQTGTMPMEFVIDLGSVYNVVGLRYYEDWSHIQDYHVYVSSESDGPWDTAVAQGTISSFGLNRIDTTAKNGRYVRIVVDSSSGRNYYYVSEINVERQ